MEYDPQVLVAVLVGLGLVTIIVALFIWLDLRRLNRKWAKEKVGGTIMKRKLKIAFLVSLFLMCVPITIAVIYNGLVMPFEDLPGLVRISVGVLAISGTIGFFICTVYFTSEGGH